MKIEDKRKVIEVLLCNAQWIDGYSGATTWNTAEEFGHRARSAIARAAGDAWDDASHSTGCSYHSNASLEAAYRLIESSATLRREWFGAK